MPLALHRGTSLLPTFALLAFSTGCAQLRPSIFPDPPPDEAPSPAWVAPPPAAAAEPLPAPPEEEDPRAQRVVHRARRLLGLRSLSKATREVRDDCAGFVTFAYRAASVSVSPREFMPNENAVSAMFREALARQAVTLGTPRPGDLVFFRETYDRNRDGRINDGLTHVGIVESIDEEGTVTFVHRGNSGVERSRFNARFPQSRVADGGQVLNDFLRPGTRSSRAFLAGELFEGYSSLARLADSPIRSAAR